MQTTPTATAWPTGVIARYLTTGGTTVDITERSGHYGVKHPTEHLATCHGCGETHTEDWGWDAQHDAFGTGPQPDFDPTGESHLPAAKQWTQAHAERCRALPRPA
ncbi:hypothetical protein [Streptomyces sp. ST2-7A]|uniref:hypothetical protein n=1 Tax=Streptomyces sp. ST2-7A TaxID=2907214 RepID=UPI001F37D4D5|nr:hypothetical protein [Streptomyces sp. ST2-7A]MCE7081189.1 hypothetical protein [Streptomyces sp. ST2-7A]